MAGSKGQPSARLAGWAMMFVAGCTGLIGGDESALSPSPDNGPGTEAPPPITEPPVVPPDIPDDLPPAESFAFTCEPGATAPPLMPTRRLTRNQLEGSIQALLRPRLGGRFDIVWAEVAATMRRVPEERTSPDEDFTRMSQAVSQAHVDGWYAVAQRVAASVTADADRRQAVFGTCAESPNAACVEAFITSFGREAFRRPVAADEQQFLAETVFGDANGPQAWAAVLTAILSSPRFLYAFEAGEPADANEAVRRLDPYELAARLALHFWRTGPDEALLEAAASGRLSEPSSYRAEVRRVFEDPRTRATLDAFVIDWLDLERVPNPAVSADRADFQTLAGNDLPSGTLRDEAIQEVLDLVRHYVWTDRQGLSALMNTTLGFPRTAQLAALYDAPTPWQPGQPPINLGTSRVSILTRVALLLNDQATTRPIIKGVRVRQRLLCDNIRLPMNMEEIKLDAATGELSLRQRIEDLTEQPGSMCVGCHALINPTGFALESFDALGRLRDQERVYGSEGQLLGAHTLDTTGNVRVDGRDVPVENAGHLAYWLSQSDEIRACFARKYVRFTFGRDEAFPNDACMMEAIRDRLEAGAPLAEVFESIALHPSFSLVRK